MKLWPISLFILVTFSCDACLCDCTDSYTIRESRVTVQDHHCVDVLQNSSRIQECVQLSDFMRSIGNSECNLELYFLQGLYALTSHNIKINTPISMLAAEGENVTITCLEKIRTDIQINATIYVNLTDENAFPSGYVTLKGLVFVECVYSIRIDYVNEINVNNCTFR